MKNYIKPKMEELTVEIEDVCAGSFPTLPGDFEDQWGGFKADPSMTAVAEEATI